MCSRWFGVTNEDQKESCSFWRASGRGKADAQQPEPSQDGVNQNCEFSSDFSYTQSRIETEIGQYYSE